MDKIPFVETHVHLWDAESPTVTRGDFRPYQAGVASIRYRAEDFIAETRFSNVTKWISVEANRETPNPAWETAWSQEQTDRLGGPHGFIARAALAAPDRDVILDGHSQYSSFRGVRDPQGNDLLGDPQWIEGVQELGRRDLVLCLDTDYRRFGLVAELAKKAPDTRIVIDHAGLMLIETDPKPDEEYIARWRQAMEVLRDHPNVIMKIGCLGLCAQDWDWTVDSFRPWVMNCIEVFGEDRVVFGTDWPINRRYSSFQDVVEAFATILADAGYSYEDQVRMLATNAERIFRI